MILTGLVSLLSVFLAESAAPTAPREGVRIMSVEEHWTIRVPVAPHPRLRIQWDEDKGPKCIPAGSIAGAFLSAPDSIDFILRGRQFVRARLDTDCEGLDFYGGFYLQSEDKRICARRDAISLRTGGSCRISKFRTLTPRVDR
jgi:hypothetical protein